MHVYLIFIYLVIFWTKQNVNPVVKAVQPIIKTKMSFCRQQVSRLIFPTTQFPDLIISTSAKYGNIPDFPPKKIQKNFIVLNCFILGNSNTTLFW